MRQANRYLVTLHIILTFFQNCKFPECKFLWTFCHKEKKICNEKRFFLSILFLKEHKQQIYLWWLFSQTSETDCKTSAYDAHFNFYFKHHAFVASFVRSFTGLILSRHVNNLWGCCTRLREFDKISNKLFAVKSEKLSLATAQKVSLVCLCLFWLRTIFDIRKLQD